MILTEKKILSGLDKIFPNYTFNKKFVDSYIRIIKFALIRYFNENINIVEDKMAFIEDFTFNIKRENKEFSSIYFVDDSLIEKIRNTLIHEFNPEHINLKTDNNELSFDDEAKLISLLVFDKLKNLKENIKTIKNNQDINFTDNYIFRFLNVEDFNIYFKYNTKINNFEFRDTKYIRGFLNNKYNITSNIEDLFNSIYLNHDRKKTRLRIVSLIEFIEYSPHHEEAEKYLVDISKPVFLKEYKIHYTNEKNKECIFNKEILPKDFYEDFVIKKQNMYKIYLKFFKEFKNEFLNFNP